MGLAAVDLWPSHPVSAPGSTCLKNIDGTGILFDGSNESPGSWAACAVPLEAFAWAVDGNAA